MLQSLRLVLYIPVGKVREIIPEEVGAGCKMPGDEHGLEVGEQAARFGVRSYLPIGLSGLLGQVVFREQFVIGVYQNEIEELPVLEPYHLYYRSQLQILLD